MMSMGMHFPISSSSFIFALLVSVSLLEWRVHGITTWRGGLGGGYHRKQQKGTQQLELGPACKGEKGGDTLALFLDKDSAVEQFKKAVELGRSFLMKSQRPEGNFHYEYDFSAGKDASDDDNSVRQAGTTWALALIYFQEVMAKETEKADETRKALMTALDFWRKHAKVVADDRRVLAYPDEGDKGKLGTVALVTLSYIDLLRADQARANADGNGAAAALLTNANHVMLRKKESNQLQEELEGFLATLLHSLDEGDNQSFRGHYMVEDGTPVGNPSPYFEGEAMLALIKAARYIGDAPGLSCTICKDKELWPRILKAADSGWKRYVEKGIADGEDNKDMKGYYQWSSMAWFEIVGAEKNLKATGIDMPGDFNDRLAKYGHWMAIRHNVNGNKKYNMGYAFEGLVPAYLAAQARREDGEDETKRAKDLACTLGMGLQNLNRFQVGHPQAAGFAKKAPKDDPRALGGVLGAADSPALRIDTTQHQLHAIMMAQQMLEGRNLI